MSECHSGETTPPSAPEGAFAVTTHVTTGISVQRIDSFEELEALAAAWAALAERLQVELPFSDVRWMKAWWKNLRRDGQVTRDSLCVLAFRRGGELVGVGPYMITSRHVLNMPLSRVLQPIGTDPNITEVRSLLVAPSDEQAVVDALLHYASTVVECDAVVISGLTAVAETRLAPQPRGGITDATSLTMFVLQLPKTWEELRAALPRNTREALRKSRNSLARDGLSPAFRVLDSETEVIDMLPRFFELHSDRAEARDTVQHSDVFGRENARAFLADLVRQFATSGRVLLFTMEIANRVVAARLAFRCHSCLYLYYSGYERAWGKHSVMTALTAEAIRYAIAANLRRVNLSTGSDQSKLRWRPEEIVIRSFAVHKQTIRAWVTRRLVGAGKWLRAKWQDYRRGGRLGRDADAVARGD
jgi:CelD/BcsL family acetyltransferase involved in cellulose biosynthesis